MDTADTYTYTACSLGFMAYQPPVSSTFLSPATSQQYFSLRTNQHQPSATSQTNRLIVFKFSDQIQIRTIDDVSNSDIHHIWILEVQL
jgi:hypothetical protein